MSPFPMLWDRLLGALTGQRWPTGRTTGTLDAHDGEPARSDESAAVGVATGAIAEDQVAAAAILRAANCPLYRGMNKIVNLPPQLQALIQDHHRYPGEGDPLRRERIQLILTDMITQMLGYSWPAAYDLLESRPVHDLNLRGRGEFHQFLRDLPVDLDEQSGWL